ncbi:MAG: IS3 family transposase [Chloroflexi bacterium]|nr:IS3 family transposase [Chloroflexota bacterium]
MIDRVRKLEPESNLKRLCELFEVNRSWYYQREQPTQKQLEDVRLREAIEQILLECVGYGYRRVSRQLQRQGWQVNHKRVLRIMREESLLCQLKKHFVPTTTNSQHGLRVYPNLLKQVELTAPNQAWVADLTYIRLQGEFVYLACLLDAFSRRCVGWHLSRQIDTQLTLAALCQAIESRHPQAGLIHHSDRGVQYASRHYVAALQEVQMRPSMSGKGNPYDNAKAESFFKTLKREEVWLHEYSSLEEAQANLQQFIEQVYNVKRLHSSLGYLPPVEFEARYQPVEDVACGGVW